MEVYDPSSADPVKALWTGQSNEQFEHFEPRSKSPSVTKARSKKSIIAKDEPWRKANAR